MPHTWQHFCFIECCVHVYFFGWFMVSVRKSLCNPVMMHYTLWCIIPIAPKAIEIDVMSEITLMLEFLQWMVRLLRWILYDIINTNSFIWSLPINVCFIIDIQLWFIFSFQISIWAIFYQFHNWNKYINEKLICIISVLYLLLLHASDAVKHYNDVIMTMMASQITSLTVVYSTFYSNADQRKHQSSASLAFVWGFHRDQWIPCTKGQ